MITYEIDHKLYVNVTNRCSNQCTFCVRDHEDGIGFDLWLTREPSIDEIIAAVGDAEPYSEVVFCGYGEPLERLPEVLDTARHLKRLGKKVRINTNGQADLIWKRPVASELAGLVDSISISLNAADAKRYQELCQPVFGEAAYKAILSFARDCLKYVPQVTLSVVDIIPQEEIEQCASIAKELGTSFRARHYDD